jgi:hypothetical protein
MSDRARRRRDEKTERLAKALRDNLRRRKAQSWLRKPPVPAEEQDDEGGDTPLG